MRYTLDTTKTNIKAIELAWAAVDNEIFAVQQQLAYFQKWSGSQDDIQNLMHDLKQLMALEKVLDLLCQFSSPVFPITPEFYDLLFVHKGIIKELKPLVAQCVCISEEPKKELQSEGSDVDGNDSDYEEGSDGEEEKAKVDLMPRERELQGGNAARVDGNDSDYEAGSDSEEEMGALLQDEMPLEILTQRFLQIYIAKRERDEDNFRRRKGDTHHYRKRAIVNHFINTRAQEEQAGADPHVATDSERADRNKSGLHSSA